MIELEENKHKLIELQKKIKNIGDSLWTSKNRITRSWRANYEGRILEWF